MLMTASCFSNNSFSGIKEISDWKLWTKRFFLIKYKYLIKISEKMYFRAIRNFGYVLRKTL